MNIEQATPMKQDEVKTGTTANAVNIYLLLASVIVFMLTAPVFGYEITTGLDSSGGYALNYFFAHQVQLGKDVLYSYGPYGFLNGPLPVGNNLPYSIAIQSILKTGFIFSALSLFFVNKRHWWQAALGVALTSFLALFTDFTLMVIFSVPLALMMGRESGKQGWYLWACILGAFGLCYKSVTGVTTFAALFMFFASEYASRKNWKLPLQYMLLTIGATLLIWFSVYGRFDGLPGYIAALPEFAQGQASAMTQNPENNWFALALMFLGFLGLPLLFRGKNLPEDKQDVNLSVTCFWVTMIVPTYLFWKYAYTRQDHSIFFLMYAVMFFVLLLGYVKRLDWRLPVAIALVFGGMYANMKYSGYDHVKFTQMKVQAQGLWHVGEVLDYPSFAARLAKASEQSLAGNRLPADMLRLASKGTVDFYPWETTYAAANPELHWSPRPVFQSHMTFRPYFDSKNSAFLSSPAGPTFMIWQKDHRGGKMGSIDYRYLLNDDPMTIEAVLTGFKPVMENSAAVLFERGDAGLLKKPRTLGKGIYRWGEWLMIPPAFKQSSPKAGLLRAKVKAVPTFLAKLKRALYKENDAWIEYRLVDGTVKKHRLVLDNMVSGLVAAPYVTEMSIPWKTASVSAIRLLHSKSDLYDPAIAIQWETLARN